MKNIGHTSKTRSVFVVEAFLAASPRYPRWSEIVPGCLKGWNTIDGRDRATDERGHCFVDIDAATKWIDWLQKNNDMRLRVVHKTVIETTSRSLIAGWECEDGQVVKDLTGEVPTFMRKEVEGCAEAMPEWYS